MPTVMGIRDDAGRRGVDDRPSSARVSAGYRSWLGFRQALCSSEVGGMRDPGTGATVPAGTVQPWGPMSALPEITIDDALVRFLDAQRPRLAPRSYRRYEEICKLLRHCLNGYGHTGLSELERKRWERAYEAGDETPSAT